jgi:hypothetical protein
MARIVGHPRPGPAQALRRPGVSPDDTLGSMPDPLLLLPDFLLIVCGYLICRHTPLDRTVWDGAEKLVYYALFPTLLFTSIVRYPQQPAELLPLAAAGVGVVLLGVVLAFALRALPGVDPLLHASGSQVAFRFNSYVALALAERMAGSRGWPGSRSSCRCACRCATWPRCGRWPATAATALRANCCATR